jgi:hypothetical protein
MNTKIVSFVSFVSIALLAYVWWPSEERTINRRLNELAAIVSVPAADTDIGRVTRVAKLGGYLADDFHARNGQQEIASRDAVLVFVGHWTPPAGGFRIEFVDVHVTVQPDAATALAYLTVKLSGHDPRTGEATVDAREANIGLAKRNGEWVITTAETAETLQHP